MSIFEKALICSIFKAADILLVLEFLIGEFPKQAIVTQFHRSKKLQLNPIPHELWEIRYYMRGSQCACTDV